MYQQFILSLVVTLSPALASCTQNPEPESVETTDKSIEIKDKEDILTNPATNTPTGKPVTVVPNSQPTNLVNQQLTPSKKEIASLKNANEHDINLYLQKYATFPNIGLTDEMGKTALSHIIHHNQLSLDSKANLIGQCLVINNSIPLDEDDIDTLCAFSIDDTKIREKFIEYLNKNTNIYLNEAKHAYALFKRAVKQADLDMVKLCITRNARPGISFWNLDRNLYDNFHILQMTADKSIEEKVLDLLIDAKKTVVSEELIKKAIECNRSAEFINMLVNIEPQKFITSQLLDCLYDNEHPAYNTIIHSDQLFQNISESTDTCIIDRMFYDIFCNNIRNSQVTQDLKNIQLNFIRSAIRGEREYKVDADDLVKIYLVYDTDTYLEIINSDHVFKRIRHLSDSLPSPFDTNNFIAANAITTIKKDLNKIYIGSKVKELYKIIFPIATVAHFKTVPREIEKIEDMKSLINTPVHSTIAKYLKAKAEKETVNLDEEQTGLCWNGTPPLIDAFDKCEQRRHRINILTDVLHNLCVYLDKETEPQTNAQKIDRNIDIRQILDADAKEENISNKFPHTWKSLTDAQRDVLEECKDALNEINTVLVSLNQDKKWLTDQQYQICLDFYITYAQDRIQENETGDSYLNQ